MTVMSQRKPLGPEVGALCIILRVLIPLSTLRFAIARYAR